MSIITRTGDRGSTGLMYNRRVSKTDARVEAYGMVDELNAALGLARSLSQDAFISTQVAAVQQQLIVLMGELATAVEDLPRYVTDGFQLVEPALTTVLDALAGDIEQQLPAFHGWAVPGGTPASAALDVARTVCRRAERQVCRLHEAGQLRNDEIIVYLNRLSDTLWLLARRAQADRPAAA